MAGVTGFEPVIPNGMRLEASRIVQAMLHAQIMYSMGLEPITFPLQAG